MLRILRDETIITDKFGPVRLQVGQEISPAEYALDDLAVSSLIGRGLALDLSPTLPQPVEELSPEIISASPAPLPKKATRKSKK